MIIEGWLNCLSLFLPEKEKFPEMQQSGEKEEKRKRKKMGKPKRRRKGRRVSYSHLDAMLPLSSKTSEDEANFFMLIIHNCVNCVFYIP